MESALTTTPLSARATSIATADLPLAVGPAMRMAVGLPPLNTMTHLATLITSPPRRTFRARFPLRLSRAPRPEAGPASRPALPLTSPSHLRPDATTPAERRRHAALDGLYGGLAANHP